MHLSLPIGGGKAKNINRRRRQCSRRCFCCSDCLCFFVAAAAFAAFIAAVASAARSVASVGAAASAFASVAFFVVASVATQGRDDGL